MVTNLLTQCQVSVVVFYMFLAFQVYSTKWSPNTRNFLMIFSRPKEELQVLGEDQRPHEGPSSQQGTPREGEGVAALWWLVGTRLGPNAPLSLLIQIYPKNRKEPSETLFSPTQVSTPPCAYLQPCSSALPEGDRSWRASTSTLLLPWWCVSSSLITHKYRGSQHSS